MVNKTTFTALAVSLASSFIFSGLVTAAPLLSEQENKDAVTQSTATPVNVDQVKAPEVPVAKQQQSSNDDNNRVEEASAAQPTAVASSNKKRTVITLESTIVGDKEQPKVLSIVPWQKPEHKVVTSTQVSRQIDLKFKPLEVESLGRELQYFKKAQQ